MHRPTARNLIGRIERVLEEGDDPFTALDLTDLINQSEIRKDVQPVNGATVQADKPQQAESQAAAVTNFPVQRTEGLKVHVLLYLMVLIGFC